MSKYKTEQQFLRHRGRSFHFVSYDIIPGNAKRLLLDVPAMWCLMEAGKRWESVRQLPEQEIADLHRCLGLWLDVHVFGDAPAA